MTVMQSKPQVREGQAGGRRCGDNTHPPCQNISQEHATKPSLGGRISCAKVITVTPVQNQQVNHSSSTTAPQPQWSCGRVANTDNQRAYGQCIQSSSCHIVDRQDNQLNFMLLFSRQLPNLIHVLSLIHSSLFLFMLKFTSVFSLIQYSLCLFCNSLFLFLFTRVLSLIQCCLCLINAQESVLYWIF